MFKCICPICKTERYHDGYECICFSSQILFCRHPKTKLESDLPDIVGVKWEKVRDG